MCDRNSFVVPPSGGSLEIGNGLVLNLPGIVLSFFDVPPSGGSLEIGNFVSIFASFHEGFVPPSGGSLEIGNTASSSVSASWVVFPLRGDP